MKRNAPPPQEPDGIETLVAKLAPMIHEMRQIQLRALAGIAPEVESIIRTRSADHQRIERTLDQLLDLCALDEGLFLFRRLCRHYFPINPTATAEYIYAYRDLWDSNSIPPSDESAQDGSGPTPHPKSTRHKA